MRNLILIAALLASTPALAITANSGTVNAGAQVTVGTAVNSNSDTDTGPGAPASLNASASASLTDDQALVSASNSIVATWASATQGNANMGWGWNAVNPGSTSATEVNTNLAPTNWEYNFTTGANAATFNGRWTLNVGFEIGSTFGIQGVYGSGGLPFNVTPFLIEPVNGTGSFSVALNPNTSYTFGFFNFGNLSNTGGGLNSNAFANFDLDWNITERGVPEPSSWAMLIAGFGLVGAAARRRRAVTA
ncbi:PEPxxWA-CTERM sorting domain-containing protein [Sandarakinorhabdus sp.]|uniref:PEPxxWA-CTERM sorting domain-containing protein n=1 Tax=Sandarakinorhabdus sp. TaxID=1916663 RepID=UPI00286EA223|nr:PEPxxWA-CTERM sorting domain-containing protein [Sandarakinorhabdus sp.]